jgi:hypothetical protein
MLVVENPGGFSWRGFYNQYLTELLSVKFILSTPHFDLPPKYLWFKKMKEMKNAEDKDWDDFIAKMEQLSLPELEELIKEQFIIFQKNRNWICVCVRENT